MKTETRADDTYASICECDGNYQFFVAISGSF